jgi:hypothetical protein
MQCNEKQRKIESKVAKKNLAVQAQGFLAN